MDMMASRKKVMMAMKSFLPNEYKRVEYIQSGANATEYIRTGIYPLYGDALSVKCLSPTIVAGGTDNFRVLGGYGGGVAIDGYYGFRGWSANGPDVVYNHVNIVDGNTHIIDVNSDGVWIYDGTQIFTGKYVGSCVVDISLFKNHYSDNALYGTFPVRIYYFKYYRDGSCIGNFIPCYRKSDNKPGMYDTVTNTFFTNAGTGEFIIPT